MKRAGYDPAAAIGLQETFVRLSENKQQNWLEGLFASHPPSAERVAANRQTAAQLGQGGILGEERYHQRIAGLMKSKDAYTYADQGREALNKHNYQQAMLLGNKAVKIVPREGHFHALLGDVYYANNDYQQALRYYDEAVSQPGDFFYFYLQRGLVREKLGARQDAVSDLEASAKLLPTATAYNGLGNMALTNGDVNRAKEYFRVGADSSSDVGRQSLQSLVRLDLPDNPGKYLSLNTALEGDAILVTEVRNTTPLSVVNIMLRISFPDNQGRLQQTSERIGSALPPGKGVQVRTGIVPVASQEMARMIRVQVVSAQVAE